jgi:hypothetical protein
LALILVRFPIVPIRAFLAPALPMASFLHPEGVHWLVGFAPWATLLFWSRATIWFPIAALDLLDEIGEH